MEKYSDINTRDEKTHDKKKNNQNKPTKSDKKSRQETTMKRLGTAQKVSVCVNNSKDL